MRNRLRKLYVTSSYHLLLSIQSLPPLSSELLCSRANTQQAMHQGVVRDMEQQRVKKERQLDFDIQKVMEEEYRKVQTVRDGGDPAIREKGR